MLLLKFLDYNADGKIDMNDLVNAFEKNGLRHCQGNNLNRAKVNRLILCYKWFIN